jgi:hypothetical protein
MALAPFVLAAAIELSSDYQPLVDGFRWARRQALEYVHDGDPVGPWYEASLPGREAFCMRDVAHQSRGAAALGLWAHNENTLRKFALAIADSRDWCGYWEIDRRDRPAPVDYRSDEDFWYNLPANFDVVQAILEVYQWTGNERYLHDPAFDNFYRRTLVDYVTRWDRNGDGLLESPKENGIRGIATYWEGPGPRIATGADLVAAQYAANRAYARILRLRHAAVEAASFDREADRLRSLFDERWWNEERGRFHSSVLEDGSFGGGEVPAMQIFALYFGIVEPARAERLFPTLERGVNVEESSYLAEAYYRYGRDEEAFGALMRQMDPELDRREYPENPFTAVGTTVRYLVGVNPLSSEGFVETRSRLPAAVGWVRLEHVPVLGNVVSVHQVGRNETRLTNESGPPIRWRPRFSVDGERTFELTVAPGEIRVARPRPTAPP